MGLRQRANVRRDRGLTSPGVAIEGHRRWPGTNRLAQGIVEKHHDILVQSALFAFLRQNIVTALASNLAGNCRLAINPSYSVRPDGA